MSVRTQCDQCHKQYEVPDEWAGRRAKCKNCGHLLEIPVPAPDAPAPLVNPLTDLLDEALGAEIADGDAAADPFGAALPAGLGSGPLQPLPSKRRKPSGEPTFGGMAMAFGRGQKLITAVLVGMCWIFGVIVYGLATSAPMAIQVTNGILLVVGLVIVAGGLQAGTPQRNRSNDSARAGRAVAWMIGGIMGVACSLGATAVIGRTGLITSAPVLARLLMPFVVVFGLVTLISGLVMVYYVLVLMFPKTNIFRISGWFYVALTVVLPIVGIMLGLMLKTAIKTLDRPSSFPSSTSRGSGVPSPFEPSFPRRPSSRGSQRPDRFGPKPGEVSRPATRGTTEVTLDSALEQLTEAYGAERVVTVKVLNMPRRDIGRVIIKMHGIVTVPSLVPTPTDSGVTFVAAPVDDIQALAKKLNFGKVTDVNANKRTITIDYGGNR